MRTARLTLALLVLAACGEKQEGEPVVSSSQLGENLCNIAAPASLSKDKGVSGQLALDLAKLVKLPVSGSVGATVNDKVTSIFQTVPQTDAVCQMLIQAVSCAAAINNRPVAEAMTEQVQQKCHSSKPLNSPDRAQVLERINVLKMEIASADRQIERLDPKTEAAGKEWQGAKAAAERSEGTSDYAELQSKAEKLEIAYWAAYRTEEHFRTEKHKRELELAKLKGQIE